MGAFELEPFAAGTRTVADAMAGAVRANLVEIQTLVAAADLGAGSPSHD